jgi:hypothetical protein
VNNDRRPPEIVIQARMEADGLSHRLARIVLIAEMREVRRLFRHPQFSCENCGQHVMWRAKGWSKSGIAMLLSSDACPACEWSKHVVYGTDDHGRFKIMKSVRGW